MVIGGAFTWAVGQIMIKKVGELNGFKLISGVAIFATPQLFMASAIFETDQIEQIQTASVSAWAMSKIGEKCAIADFATINPIPHITATDTAIKMWMGFMQCFRRIKRLLNPAKATYNLHSRFRKFFFQQVQPPRLHHRSVFQATLFQLVN